MLPPKKLKPYKDNAKKHTPDQIAALIATMTEFGFDQPIVVDKDFTIIKGHGRRIAAIQMGLKEVPVIVRADLSPEAVRIARLMDNDVVSSEWDLPMLRDDLHELQELGGTLAMACVSDTAFEDICAASEPMTISVSDIHIKPVAPKHDCPKCAYRW
jgi:hypothetical protein